MREDPDNHRRLFDGGDDPELAATLRAVLEVDEKLARYLADNPAKAGQPASTRLVKLLEEWHPCPK